MISYNEPRIRYRIMTYPVIPNSSLETLSTVFVSAKANKTNQSNPAKLFSNFGMQRRIALDRMHWYLVQTSVFRHCSSLWMAICRETSSNRRRRRGHLKKKTLTLPSGAKKRSVNWDDTTHVEISAPLSVLHWCVLTEACDLEHSCCPLLLVPPSSCAQLLPQPNLHDLSPNFTNVPLIFVIPPLQLYPRVPCGSQRCLTCLEAADCPSSAQACCWPAQSKRSSSAAQHFLESHC